MSETKRKKEPWEIDLDRELEEVMRDELDGYNRFAEDDDWEAAAAGGRERSTPPAKPTKHFMARRVNK